MQLKPFLLDMWLDNYEHDIEFNLASSEGPRWTVNALLNLAGEEERQRFLNHELFATDERHNRRRDCRKRL